jgi:putative YphP/YqiW family bacilliredoxin
MSVSSPPCGRSSLGSASKSFAPPTRWTPGCAARNARPAVASALRHSVKPDHLATVFAGQDVEATAKARAYFTGYPPSSPSIGLLKDGEIVFMLERWQIEGRSSDAIAADLTDAFDRFCGKTVSA